MVAFIWGVISLIAHIFSGFTTFGHNLKQIGMRVSWTYGTPKEISEEDAKMEFAGYLGKFGLSLVGCVFNSVTSWLFLILLPFSLVRRMLKVFGVPRDVRDARWRLKDLRMDFDGVFRNLKAIEGKTEYQLDRAELLKSLRERNLINEYAFNRLMAAGPSSGQL